MKNADLWQSYKEYTETLSTNARTLGFAAAGVCWLFKSEDGVFPRQVLLALVFAVLFFLSDMLQFLIAALCLRVWTRRKEKEFWKLHGTIDKDYHKPAWLDAPAYGLWWIKVLCLLTAFVLIGTYVWSQAEKPSASTVRATARQ